MFLIRWTFWIALVVMLLPTDKVQQERLYQHASNASHWAMTFCDRNPTTCTRAGELWVVFQAKAQFAAALAGDVIRERLNQATVAAPASPATGFAPAAAPALAPVHAPSGAPTHVPASSAPADRQQEIFTRPIKPQDRLPLYPQQRARWDG